jgi:group I intron endonuclease
MEFPFNYSDLFEIQDFLAIFVPIMVYSNPDTNKLQILSENKGKAAIYQWTHIESGKRYVGSAVDLEKRLLNYFNGKYLENSSMYIYRALILHGYGAFSLTILEYIDIPGLSKKDARKLILEREQHYLDIIFSEDEPNTYNMLKVAGSVLGYLHTVESLAKISQAQSPGGLHPRGSSPQGLSQVKITIFLGEIIVMKLKL